MAHLDIPSCSPLIRLLSSLQFYKHSCAWQVSKTFLGTKDENLNPTKKENPIWCASRILFCITLVVKKVWKQLDWRSFMSLHHDVSMAIIKYKKVVTQNGEHTTHTILG